MLPTPPRTRVSRAVAALLSLQLSLSASGQTTTRDKVTLQLPGSTSRTIIAGSVLDYTGQSIVILTRTGVPPRTYPAEHVIDVQTSQTRPHMQGLEEFTSGRIESAARSFGQALEEESRPWVRRDILALLVRCAFRNGDYVSAAARFTALVESDPHTRHFELIPLWWRAAPAEPIVLHAARVWLTGAAPVSRMIGASYLLSDSEYQSVAEAELNKLAAGSGDLRLHRLAQVQLWRLRLAADDLGPEELARWQARIDSMPAGLQGGPYYVLGQGRLRMREHDRAAVALLRVPILYDWDHRLAARACLEAADALAAAGLKDQAVTLYREVEARFGDTTYAGEARSMLTSLRTPP